MKRIALVCFILLQTPLFGQIIDNFSDGDLTDNPTWAGDDTKFVITEGELNSLNSEALTYYLTTPSTLSSEGQWEFFINLKFSTSGANFVDVYLMSDNADLNASMNGYFVRIGNTADDISFYKILDGVETMIIDGDDGSINSSSNNPFNIKISRSVFDLWTLEIDDGAIGSYVVEGTIVDNDINSSAYFGVKIKQSSAASPVNMHFFDNFSVKAIVPDVLAPVLNTISVMSNTEIDLKFDEVLDETTAEAITNYTINNSIGSPISATLDAVDKSLVHLTFGIALLNFDYKITVQNIEDESGNSITNQVLHFTVLIPELAVLGDFVINEIMADPSPEVGLPNSEYVEIYNRSNKYIDLANYTLSGKVITSNTTIIAPNEHFILCDEDNLILLETLGAVIGLPSWNTLTNGGEEIILADQNGLIIDLLTYSTNWYNDTEKDDGGWSLERINPDHQCSDEDNWTASVGSSGGTPGAQNSVFDDTPDLTGPMLLSAIALSTDSLKVTFDERLDTTNFASGVFTFAPVVAVDTIYVEADLKAAIVVFSELLLTSINYTVSVTALSDCSGNDIGSDQSAVFLLTSASTSNDIIITEIMADPRPVVGLPDAEYVELYNRSSAYFDLLNYTLNDEVITTSDYILSPMEYVLLVPESQLSLFTDITNVVGVTSWDALTNGGEQITLKSSAGLVIEQVTYDLGWHTEVTKDDGGWSLERINPDHLCSDEDNWSSSNNVLGGTPGTENSVFDDTPDLTGPMLLSTTSLSIDSLKVTFDERLDTANFAVAVFTFDPTVAVDTIYVETDLKTAIVVFSELLQTSTNYTVSVTTLSDCSGNDIGSGQSATFLLTSTATSNDIIISEIMADPTPEVGLPIAEYVEIYNRSDKHIDLINYAIDGETITEENKIIQPNEYIILCDNSDEVLFEPFGETIGVASWNSLTNDGQSIALTDASTLLIDEVEYNDGWYSSIDKSDGGWSLELIDTENVCGEENNWSSSIDENGGTPGSINSINGNKPDLTGPSLLSAIAISPDSLILKFDERIDANTFSLTGYSFEPSLTIARTTLAGEFREIVIVLSTKMQVSTEYQLSISSLRDCNGNLIRENNTQLFALSEVAEQGDLLINELLYNPITSGGDFLEIYNDSEKYINLKGWAIANGSDILPENLKVVSENHLLIAPQQYLVFSQYPLAVAADYPRGIEENFVGVSSLPSFPNDGQGVVLLSPAAQVIDFFPYDDDMQHTLLDSDKGVSLERISFDNPTSDPNNWHSAAKSEGFATPGYVNSQSLEVSTNTSDNILISPQVFLPNQSGQNDFTTINYSFNQPGFIATVTIVDAAGRVISSIAQNELLATEGFFQWDGTMDNGRKARSGGYIVLFEVFDLSGNKKKYNKRVVVAPEL